MKTQKPSAYDVIIQGMMEGRDPIKALDEAGYVVQPKPVTETPRAVNDDRICSDAEMAMIEDIVAKMMASARAWTEAADAFKGALDLIKDQKAKAEHEAVLKAIVTGNFTRISDRMFREARARDPFGITKAQLKALKDREAYLKAIGLVRGGKASKDDVIAALGRVSPDGEQGNVWELWEKRQATKAQTEISLDVPYPMGSVIAWPAIVARRPALRGADGGRDVNEVRQFTGNGRAWIRVVLQNGKFGEADLHAVREANGGRLTEDMIDGVIIEILNGMPQPWDRDILCDGAAPS